MQHSSKATEVDDVIKGSGNVFADLGIPNADQEQTKARLTLEISRIIKDRGLTQVEAAKDAALLIPHTYTHNAYIITQYAYIAYSRCSFPGSSGEGACCYLRAA